MANIDTLRSVLDSHLQNNWNKQLIRWDNVAMPLSEEVEWIRPTLNIEAVENVTIGGSNNNTRVRYTGSYIIQIFSPLTKGTGDIYREVDKIVKLFDNKRFDENIFTYASDITRVGDEGNGWYQINVSIPFTSDRLHDD